MDAGTGRCRIARRDVSDRRGRAAWRGDGRCARRRTGVVAGRGRHVARNDQRLPRLQRRRGGEVIGRRDGGGWHAIAARQRLDRAGRDRDGRAAVPAPMAARRRHRSGDLRRWRRRRARRALRLRGSRTGIIRRHALATADGAGRSRPATGGRRILLHRLRQRPALDPAGGRRGDRSGHLVGIARLLVWIARVLVVAEARRVAAAGRNPAGHQCKRNHARPQPRQQLDGTHGSPLIRIRNMQPGELIPGG